MSALIIPFTPEERQAMTRPPDPTVLRLAENDLIKALFNYRQVSSGASDELVSYLDVPDVPREYFFRLWAVPVAMQAIWRDME